MSHTKNNKMINITSSAKVSISFLILLKIFNASNENFRQFNKEEKACERQQS